MQRGPGHDPAGRDDAQTWRPLRLFALYRLVLAGLFLTLSLTDNLPPPIGEAAPVLFEWATGFYLLLAVAARFAVQTHRPRFNLQVFGQVLLDVGAVTVLMHASGGVSSGLGVLLVVSVAGGSILTQGRVAGLFAALAALAVLGEEVFTQLYMERPETSYPQAGMLGVALFATAFLAQVLSRRIRESEALATRRGVDLANMAQLTEYVVQRLDTGVVVVDPDGRIRLLNEAAGGLLGGDLREGAYLEGVAPALAERLRSWRESGPAERALHVAATEAELVPRFIGIGPGPAGGILILLEDAHAAARQAQQLKLAALGRLTASIAHEVRNPLGAISHAGELLDESPELSDSDRRLVEIVLTQSRRVNAIIENVLGLGRRDRSQPTDLDLGPWLTQFVKEFVEVEQLSCEAVAVDVEGESLPVRFDPSHLHQVLWNLCQNGVRAAAAAPDPKVMITAGRAGRRPYLEVQDRGPGIDPETAQKLFEPFFTTAADGTGLGLYIARELTECNEGRLEHLPGAEGARFRLSFPDVSGQTSSA